MTNSNLCNLVKFFEAAGKLKRTPRSGWVEVGIQKPESVADHTFRTSILCMVYSDLENLDELKLLRMALIHDLPEAIIGDLTPLRKTARSKEKENNAMNQILSLLPKRQREKYMTDWKEYQEGKTREAKAVRQLEKLEMALQAKEYEEAELTRQSLKRFIKSAEETIIWPQLKRLLSHILEEPGK
ncbi:MAG: HD domain-containing protein [Candidatus Bathyarchaeaceae archaeon]